MTVFLLSVGIFLWIFPDASSAFRITGSPPWTACSSSRPSCTVPDPGDQHADVFRRAEDPGTLELLLTRPRANFTGLRKVPRRVCLGGVVVDSYPDLLLPRSTVWRFQPGNVDTVCIAGSGIGLLFLSPASWQSASLLGANEQSGRRVLFALILCYSFHAGFDAFALLGIPVRLQNILSQLGIANHYAAMSRGVMDSRDLLYFVSLTNCFCYFCSASRLEKENGHELVRNARIVCFDASW
ncbi:hypothetical protein [Candidatus Pollutiaquabacter sp.]|uniref:hypothetical protein n=1 Tax=Candidatus Pollutiaquabacter sp. TaxID=3416354 RepID=UPI003CA8CF8A|nr:hypothetical protein [Bacteroidota bacterium]